MAHETQSSRRAFLGALGAGVAAAGAAAAQPLMPPSIIDFHNHYMGPSWTLTNLAGLPPTARPAWEKINANLQSEVPGVFPDPQETPDEFVLFDGTNTFQFPAESM